MQVPNPISLTKLSDATCPMKYYLRHIEGYEPKDTAVALLKGRYYHALDSGEEINWSELKGLTPEDKDMVERVHRRAKIWLPQLSHRSLDREVDFSLDVNGITVHGRADAVSKDRTTIYEIKTTSSAYSQQQVPHATWQLNMLNYLSGGSQFNNLVLVIVKFLLPARDAKRRSKYADQIYYEEEAENVKPKDGEEIPEIAPIIEEAPVIVWSDNYCWDWITAAISMIEKNVAYPIYNNLLCGFCDFKNYCRVALPGGWGDNWLEDNCVKKEKGVNNQT